MEVVSGSSSVTGYRSAKVELDCNHDMASIWDGQDTIVTR
jgi:hypothetical protein